MSTEVDIDQLAKQLVNLTVKEVKELADKLKSDYGIEPAAAPVAVVAGGGAGAGEQTDAAAAKSEFDVKITGFDAGKKLGVIKLLKDLLGLGLQDAKAVTENLPKVIKEKVAKAEAEDLKKKLEEAGVTVELV